MKIDSTFWLKCEISGRFVYFVNMTVFSSCRDLGVLVSSDLSPSVHIDSIVCLQCFDAVGWAAGRASGL